MGTLKSTRTSTRLPRRSTSDILSTRIDYFAFINATVASSIRLLKPHSLSYQDDTFTSVPLDTRVRVASNTLLAVLWLKSEDTSSSVLYSRIRFRCVCDACLAASLTSSTVVGLFATKVRSTIDTLIVGTRNAYPSSLPLRCGNTKQIAAAAPELAGIMLCVADRA